MRRTCSFSFISKSRIWTIYLRKSKEQQNGKQKSKTWRVNCDTWETNKWLENLNHEIIKNQFLCWVKIHKVDDMNLWSFEKNEHFTLQNKRPVKLKTFARRKYCISIYCPCQFTMMYSLFDFWIHALSTDSCKVIFRALWYFLVF